MLLLKTIEIRGVILRKVLFFILFISISWGVDIRLDETSSSIDKIKSSRDKRYFGEELFRGNFKENKQLTYNSNYLINIGDIVSIKLWGAYEYSGELTVDNRGNIFIPKVGTIRLLGVKQSRLKSQVRYSVNEVFNNNVSVYANLNSYHNISVFVTGGVVKPGLYTGASSDSILQFLDKADGIKYAEGSYREITLIRNKRVIRLFDLYAFLVNGKLDIIQFQNGDVIKVSALKNRVEVSGDVSKPCIFETKFNKITIDELTRFILPKPTVTHFTITSWENGHQKIKKYRLDEQYRVMLKNGEKIHFLSDHLKDNLTIGIEGEHGNLHTMMIEKGVSLKELLSKIIMTPLSDASAVQLYRKSIALKQKQLIDANLRDLEARVLTTGSSTTEEAKIRKEESAMVMNFIDRASKVKPKGQVIINNSTDLSSVTLEDGDRIFIPKKSQVVVVEGEVSLPNAQTFVAKYSVEDYIKSCGGYSPRANKEKVLLVKKNGRVITYNASSWWGEHSFRVEPGDSILVLGKVDSKNIQITSSVTQILYQIAVGAAVVLRAF
jgi:protein involved in polysaccharide export with SLBB domain